MIRVLRLKNEPYFESVALKGIGVFDTLKGMRQAGAVGLSGSDLRAAQSSRGLPLEGNYEGSEGPFLARLRSLRRRSSSKPSG